MLGGSPGRLLAFVRHVTPVVWEDRLMTYELWDTETCNLVEAFEDESMAWHAAGRRA